MAELPLLSGQKIVKALSKIGYLVERQRSSHLRLIAPGRKPVTVPDYKIVGRGLLRKIIRDTEISTEQFIELLKK